MEKVHYSPKEYEEFARKIGDSKRRVKDFFFGFQKMVYGRRNKPKYKTNNSNRQNPPGYFTIDQLTVLKREYSQNIFPTVEDREVIDEEIGSSSKSVKVNCLKLSHLKNEKNC